MVDCYLQKSGIKPEVVDLCGALVDWTTEKSSRKNVFQVGNFILTSYSHLCHVPAALYLPYRLWKDNDYKIMESA